MKDAELRTAIGIIRWVKRNVLVLPSFYRIWKRLFFRSVGHPLAFLKGGRQNVGGGDTGKGV